MQIRMVVTDMDDTLLQPGLVISPRTVRAISLARQKGVKVCLASGRLPAGMRKYHALLNLDTPMIAGNGATIVLPSGEVLRQTPLELDVTREVIQLADEMGLYVQIYDGDVFYYNIEDGVCAEGYRKGTGMQGHHAAHLLEKLVRPTEKILAMAAPERIPELIEFFNTRFAGRLAVTSSKKTFLELSHPQATKGYAAAYVAHLLGIDAHETLCCGDGLNDISMVKWAGVGVAMGNGHPALLAAADYVAPPNTQDGLAEAIERFVLC